MKKLFSYIAILVFMIGVFAPVAQVYGQAPATPAPVPAPGGTPTPAPARPAVETGRWGGDVPVPDKDSPGWFMERVYDLLSMLSLLILKLTSFVLWLGGVLLNESIRYTIIDMSENIRKMTGINVGWKVIRDLMNMGFVFLLVYQGILMIIGMKENYKDIVVGVVMASILINFSLFFTKVLIDGSNIATIGFYNAILGDNAKDQKYGLSNAFMKPLGLTAVFERQAIDSFQQNASNDPFNMIVIGLMGSLLFLITAFVFFTIACLLLVRYITLLILMTLSPIAYLGMAYPGIEGAKKASGEWWTTLTNQLVFAPVFMIMAWIVLTLLSSPGFVTISGGDSKWAEALIPKKDPSSGMVATASASTVGIFINFAIIIGLMLGALSTAKSTATKGSDSLKKWSGEITSRAGKFVGGVTTGTVGVLGRNTVGAVASRLDRSEKFQKFAGSGIVGKTLFKANQKVASSSFDARNTALVQSVSNTTGVNLGKGSTNTFDKTIDERKKGHIDFAKSLDLSKEGREKYARSISGEGFLAKYFVKNGSVNSKRTLLGTLGRGNRLAAASIFGERVKELVTQYNELRKEQDNLQKIFDSSPAGTPPGTARPLDTIEQDRLNELKGAGGLVDNAQKEVERLRAEISGQGLNKTSKQNY